MKNFTNFELKKFQASEYLQISKLSWLMSPELDIINIVGVQTPQLQNINDLSFSLVFFIEIHNLKVFPELMFKLLTLIK